MSDYIPINCEFHDRLEAWVTTRAKCEIEFTSPQGSKRSATCTIEDVFASGSEEFIRLADGELIRLDRIESVNGHRLPT